MTQSCTQAVNNQTGDSIPVNTTTPISNTNSSASDNLPCGTPTHDPPGDLPEEPPTPPPSPQTSQDQDRESDDVAMETQPLLQLASMPVTQIK